MSKVVNYVEFDFSLNTLLYKFIEKYNFSEKLKTTWSLMIKNTW